MRTDPIGFEGGDANLYGYVLNDPNGKIDFSGNAVTFSGCSAVQKQMIQKALKGIESTLNNPPKGCVIGKKWDLASEKN